MSWDARDSWLPKMSCRSGAGVEYKQCNLVIVITRPGGRMESEGRDANHLMLRDLPGGPGAQTFMARNCQESPEQGTMAQAATLPRHHDPQPHPRRRPG